MPIGRPFLDSSGTRGRPKIISHVVARTQQGKKIRFEQLNATHIKLTIINDISTENRTIKINKNDGIALAHWLLDVCSSKGK
jgi:hypothetical protein